MSVLSSGVVRGFFHCIFSFYNEMIHSSPACLRKKVSLSLECYLRFNDCFTAREEGHGWFTRTGWCLEIVLLLASKFFFLSVTY